jgi:hypothetical protein
MSPEKRIKIALDENRMSIMGVQILFGFQLQAPFQRMFDALPDGLKYASLVAFMLLTAAIALLIAPSAYHRIVTKGGVEASLEHGITCLIDGALALLGLAVALDLYLAGEHIIGGWAGLVFALVFGFLAFAFWYGIALVHRAARSRKKEAHAMAKNTVTPLEDRIDFVLTEARVVLPGVQALLGFQLVVILSEAFEKLPAAAALVHLAALGAVAISIVLLIAPAAHHRIVYGGEDSESFLGIATAYLVGATVFLALGIAGEWYLIAAKILKSEVWGIVGAASSALLCLGLWHVLPLIARSRRRDRTVTPDLGASRSRRRP